MRRSPRFLHRLRSPVISVSASRDFLARALLTNVSGSQQKPAPCPSASAIERDETRERKAERTARFQDTRGTTLTSNDAIVGHRRQRRRVSSRRMQRPTRPSRFRHRPLYIIADCCIVCACCIPSATWHQPLQRPWGQAYFFPRMGHSYGRSDATFGFRRKTGTKERGCFATQIARN